MAAWRGHVAIKPRRPANTGDEQVQGPVVIDVAANEASSDEGFTAESGIRCRYLAEVTLAIVSKELAWFGIRHPKRCDSRSDFGCSPRSASHQAVSNCKVQRAVAIEIAKHSGKTGAVPRRVQQAHRRRIVLKNGAHAFAAP